ncbi:MAG TPA: VWA domain-containing protein [Spirochaetes bacterium]|nr:VWA domain-containing protein [Spirochaetota bacterium]
MGDILDEVDFDSVEAEGTAIGEALALAASRMMDSTAKSRVIFLLTDGMNNRGSIDPETAARMCAELGIRIYSVGIGKEGKVPYPGRGTLFGFRQYLDSHFDEASIRLLSELTGGKFYRATDSKLLFETIKDIDRLEKSDIKLRTYRRFSDRFEGFLIAAMAVFFLELLLRSLVYRKAP